MKTIITVFIQIRANYYFLFEVAAIESSDESDTDTLQRDFAETIYKHEDTEEMEEAGEGEEEFEEVTTKTAKTATKIYLKTRNRDDSDDSVDVKQEPDSSPGKRTLPKRKKKKPTKRKAR